MFNEEVRSQFHLAREFGCDQAHVYHSSRHVRVKTLQGYCCMQCVESAASNLGNRKASFIDYSRYNHVCFLILNEVLHFPRIDENSLSFRAINKAGLDLLGQNGVLAIAHGKIQLTPKGSLYACEVYHLPRGFQSSL